ncbi:MAG: hypothetical protein CR967_00135 [Proteobacteria bacterium]|nr:MAG: hypothetical protein CR967_00135 [Pseudomonadota bacterium]
MQLMLTYKKESKKETFEEFWENKSGDFDIDDKTHVLYMMEFISKNLDLDEYALKRLEITIKTELPFFACKRFLAKKWLMENFEY